MGGPERRDRVHVEEGRELKVAGAATPASLVAVRQVVIGELVPFCCAPCDRCVDTFPTAVVSRCGRRRCRSFEWVEAQLGACSSNFLRKGGSGTVTILDDVDPSSLATLRNEIRRPNEIISQPEATIVDLERRTPAMG
jgi:hypothetical protein